MPFEPGLGSKPYGGGGRKGYELENEQLEKMRKIVSSDLTLVEKIYDGQASEEDFKRLQALQARISKYLDKLHPTRQTQEHSGEITLPQPIYGGISKYNSDTKDIQAEQENKGS